MALTRALGLLCLSALLLAGVAQGRDLLQLKYYGNSMQECAKKAGLTYTSQAMELAGAEIFKNPYVEATFFAMDNNNWVTLGKLQKPPMTVNQMLQDKGFVGQILKNHIIGGLVPTQNWPATIGPQNTKTFQSLGASQLTLWTDYKYTYRAGGWMGYNQLGCQLTNLQCGSGIMHVVTDAWDSPAV